MMICKCDGCGKEQSAMFANYYWFKPHNWFERTPIGEIAIQACSRECIEAVEQQRKAEEKPSCTVVLPI